MNTKNKNRIQNGLIQSKKTLYLYHISKFSAQESSYRIRTKPQMKKNSQQKNSSEVLESCLLLGKGEYFHMLTQRKEGKEKRTNWNCCLQTK